jgi:hypothetical protein
VASAIAVVTASVLPPKGGSHESDHGATESDHGATESDHGATESDHGATKSDHGATESDHVAPKSDHVATESDHGATKSDHVASAFRRKDADHAALIVVLALAASAALPLYAYYQGHPVRIRYAVPLVAASAALIGSAVALLPRRVGAAAGLILVAFTGWQVRPFDRQAPVVLESQRDVSNAEGRRAVTTYLAANWDGRPIMISMGSLGHYMHDLSAAGFGIGDFLHEGNGEIWKYAARHPHPVAEWIAIEERSEGGDALAYQAKIDANFLRGYARVAEGGGVALYRRN